MDVRGKQQALIVVRCADFHPRGSINGGNQSVGTLGDRIFAKQQQQTNELTSVTQQMANLTAALGIEGVMTPEALNLLKQQIAIVDQKQDEVEALQ